jgi:hypothetical protein
MGLDVADDHRDEAVGPEQEDGADEERQDEAEEGEEDDDHDATVGRELHRSNLDLRRSDGISGDSPMM